MPRISEREVRDASRVWEGECPAPKCEKAVRIEAAPWQPKVDVLRAFKYVRPTGRHAHGTYVVNGHWEYGGE
ncbi:MAG: hypothetical protein HY535_08075 [Chloroflexi bacterium]|nr:hypothetical protein [Chloroflexota bacterium]